MCWKNFMIWKKKFKIPITMYKTMLSYWLECKKNTESENPKIVRAKNGRTKLLSKCKVSDSKKVKFIKENEASGL